MKLSISADIDLDGFAAGGYVTWFDAKVEGAGGECAVARVALVHVGEISDALGDLWPALRGTRLETLHDVYFSQGWYKDDFADGAGLDLLYIESLTIPEAWRNKNLDLAIVQRLADTIGSGCQLVTMGYGSALAVARWAQLGFAISTPGHTAGFMHMKLGFRHSRVIDTTGAGDFQIMGPSSVVPPPIGDRYTHN